ncbi:conserved hypothetical protein [Histoplasma capsulatum H143]|uniref:Uncharacterized protein n=1 Tax=Ajellomyces capsulatus (strain H143) TaxID=544712 RepID=C6HM49_AJECH|nr:conserved hypothetical protein [Histoplasma capsulatum H143]
MLVPMLAPSVGGLDGFVPSTTNARFTTRQTPMFRRPQDHEPDPETSQLGRILSPLRIYTWGPVAMSYLGVPIVIRDKDFEKATRKLEDSGFIPSSPNRNPAPEIMAGLPDPQAVLRQINEDYERVDRSCKTFNCPSHLLESFQQILLIPSSFASLPDFSSTTTELNATKQSAALATAQYDTFGNILYPHQQTLLESLIRAAIVEETNAGFTSRAASMKSWVSMMVGYFGIEKDILDDCLDEQVATW